MARIFVIGPPSDPLVVGLLDGWCRGLLNNGHEVYRARMFPDPFENDHGISSLERDCDALVDADEVHILYDPDDEESLLYLGMLLAFLYLGHRKKVVLINSVAYTMGPSLANVLRALERGYPFEREGPTS